MRIIGGKYGKRTLSAFAGEEIRPTSDFARESLFNVLGGRIEGAAFLDLFCGTGAVGLEALSRGADRAVFNDVSRDSIKLAKKNAESLGVGREGEFYNFSAENFINLKAASGEKFDFIFIDAPYRSGEGEKAVALALKILAVGGQIIYENQTPAGEIEGLVKTDERRYGRAYLCFYSAAADVKTCVFAGTFDPVTVGHIEIIDYCAKNYGKVLVVIGENPQKKVLFSEKTRKEALARALEKYKNTEIFVYSEVEDYAELIKRKGAKYYVRGIRDDADLAFEKQYEEKNRAIYPFIETVYVRGEKYLSVSSSLVKEKISEGEDYLNYIPEKSRKIIRSAVEKLKK